MYHSKMYVSKMLTTRELLEGIDDFVSSTPKDAAVATVLEVFAAAGCNDMLASVRIAVLVHVRLTFFGAEAAGQLPAASPYGDQRG